MSGGDEYIIVRNWRKFQRYENRNPPWIKNHTRLLHNDNYLSLPPGTRAILHGLWLEYASSNARLRLDTASLSARLRLRVTKQQLKRLEQAGFITFAHTPRVQDVCASRTREETETGKEQELTYEEKLDQASYPQATDEEEPFDFDVKNLLKEML